MNLPRKINPDNLIETIVEVRIIPKCPSELWAGMVSVPLMNLGYKYIPAPQLNVRLDKNGKTTVSLNRSEENASSGIFVKENIRFIMDGNSVSFNCNMGHYVGWESYLKEIKDVINTIQECGITQNFNRVQIRYISEYQDIDIIDHINGDICIGDKSNPFKSQEIKLNRIDGNMKIFVSLTNKMKRRNLRGEERFVSLFDVNIYENFEDSDSIETVSTLLDKIHQIEKETFFGLLKQDFIQSLNPEY